MLRLFACAWLFVTAACVFDEGETPTDVDTEDNPAEQEPLEEDDPAADDTTTPMPAVLAKGCTATANLGGYPTWFFFTRPDKPCKGTAGSGIDHHIVDELTRLISSVPAGGRIDGHIFSITVDGVAKRAARRAEPRRARLDLDGRRCAASRRIPRRRSTSTSSLTSSTARTATDECVHLDCRTRHLAHQAVRVQHGDRARRRGRQQRRVVRLREPDLRERHEALQQHRHGATATPRCTRTSRAISTTCYAQRRAHATTTIRRAAAATCSRRRPTSTSHRRPDRTSSSTASTTSRPTRDCRVRVMQASIRDSRLDVVDRLVRMKKGGCSVWVVARHHRARRSRRAARGQDPDAHQTPIHDKSFIVYGKYGAAYAVSRLQRLAQPERLGEPSRTTRSSSSSRPRPARRIRSTTRTSRTSTTRTRPARRSTSCPGMLGQERLEDRL